MNPAAAYVANFSAAMEVFAAVGYITVWLIASVIVIALVEFVSRARAFNTNRRVRRTSPPAGASRPVLAPVGAAHAERPSPEPLGGRRPTPPPYPTRPTAHPTPAKPLFSVGGAEQGRGDGQR